MDVHVMCVCVYDYYTLQTFFRRIFFSFSWEVKTEARLPIGSMGVVYLPTFTIKINYFTSSDPPHDSSKQPR